MKPDIEQLFLVIAHEQRLGGGHVTADYHRFRKIFVKKRRRFIAGIK
jgi:hypothetical protein